MGPNPGSAAGLRFHLAHPAWVRLQVFDAARRLVVTLVDGDQPAGTHTIALDGARVGGCVYF